MTAAVPIDHDIANAMRSSHFDPFAHVAVLVPRARLARYAEREKRDQCGDSERSLPGHEFLPSDWQTCAGACWGVLNPDCAKSEPPHGWASRLDFGRMFRR